MNGQWIQRVARLVGVLVLSGVPAEGLLELPSMQALRNVEFAVAVDGRTV
jgi:hypothetical protein